MNCQPKPVDGANDVHDRDRPVTKQGIALGRLDGSKSWDLLPAGPLRLAPRAGGHPRTDPCPQHKVCVVLTVQPFFILGGFTSTRVSGINCATAVLTAPPPAAFSRGSGLARGQVLPSLALLRYLRRDRYRALVPILPTVQDFTRTPRRYRERHSTQLRRRKRGVRHRQA